MDNTMDELKRMYKSFIEELEDYDNLQLVDFVIKYCGMDTQKEIDEQYKDYLSYEEDLEDKDTWIKEVYQEENKQELTDQRNEYFQDYGRDEYVNTRDDKDKIVDINLAGGGPCVDLRVETKWNSVEWEGRWGGTRLTEDCSYYYDTIESVYNINTY